jgi:hypothetical protein
MRAVLDFPQQQPAQTSESEGKGREGASEICSIETGCVSVNDIRFG